MIYDLRAEQAGRCGPNADMADDLAAFAPATIDAADDDDAAERCEQIRREWIASWQEPGAPDPTGLDTLSLFAVPRP